MPSPHEELLSIASDLEAVSADLDAMVERKALDSLKHSANEVGRAFSGSWLGYHSRVYYADLEAPPPGAHFSQEWGLKKLYGTLGTRGDWREFDAAQLKQRIREMAGNPDLSRLEKAVAGAVKKFEAAKSDIISIICSEIETKDDTFLAKLREELEELEPLTAGEVASRMHKKGQVMTRDTTALGQGSQIPPHVAILAEVLSLGHSLGICQQTAGIARRAGSHISRKFVRSTRDARVGTNVFIGHGRSAAWRELKDFVQDRLHLPWDEFNRVPVAGVTNIARLSEMLDAAAIAFVIMTAEEETSEGKLQARMNVIHEVGLFQGRLGFTKGIVVLEEGCEEFTNIQGLGQIRFPKGRITACFEDLRQVLEREGVISV
jgi:hypothetical protein